jgi:predicted Zn-dependent peptidase
MTQNIQTHTFENGLTLVVERMTDVQSAAFSLLVPAGGSLETGALDSGTHRFQCLIHPWQRTTAEAR